MNNTAVNRSNPRIVVEMIEYTPNVVTVQNIVVKMDSVASITSFSAGNERNDEISPFDVYIQIVEGSAGLTIEDKNYRLERGEGMVIPAHRLYRFNMNDRFRMLSTIVKNAYDVWD